NATRLCAATHGVIERFNGEQFVVTATYGVPPEMRTRLDEVVASHPLRPGPGSLVGRVAREGRTLQVVDVLADPSYELGEAQQLLGYRTLVAVPMFREGSLVGAFALYRQQVEAFTDKQIELVTTFADQAVIAIENTRLFRELQEKLEQEAATSEILRAIASSPGDLETVLGDLVRRAALLTGSPNSRIFR